MIQFLYFQQLNIMKQKIMYWTKAGLDAKKALKSQKIKVGNKFRHPKLNELSLQQVVLSKERSLEEWKALFKQQREEAKMRKEERPFSKLHNKLINRAYGKLTNSLRKSALEAAHEERIRRIILRRGITAHLRAFDRDTIKPNILIVKTENNWKINDFMCIPSSHDLDTLRRIGTDMANKLSTSMKNFFSIEIWEKSEYIKKMAGDNSANYRYHIGRK